MGRLRWVRLDKVGLGKVRGGTEWVEYNLYDER